MPKRKKDEIGEIFKINNKLNKMTTTYVSLIQNANVNEIDYFNGMPYEAQMKIIDDLSLLKMMTEINTPYRIQLLNTNIFNFIIYF
jgi:hypothetical protein